MNGNRGRGASSKNNNNHSLKTSWKTSHFRPYRHTELLQSGFLLSSGCLQDLLNGIYPLGQSSCTFTQLFSLCNLFSSCVILFRSRSLFQSAWNYLPKDTEFFLVRPPAAFLLCAVQIRDRKLPVPTFPPSPVAHQVLLLLKVQRGSLFSTLAPPKILTLGLKKCYLLQYFILGLLPTMFPIVITSISYFPETLITLNMEISIVSQWFKLHKHGDFNCISMI